MIHLTDPNPFGPTAFADPDPDEVHMPYPPAYAPQDDDRQFDPTSPAGSRVDRAFISNRADEFLAVLEDLAFMPPQALKDWMCAKRRELLDNRQRAIAEGRV